MGDKLMKIKIIFLPSTRDFQRKEKILIKKIILRHAKKAAKALGAKNGLLTFTIYPWERDGVHAFTQAKDWVRITINPQQFISKRKRQDMIERLIYIVYHETHHAFRGYAGFLPKKKSHILMNSIISEGLADIFAQEQYPSEYVRKITRYDNRQIKKWLPKLHKIKWQKEIIYDSWLYGGRGKPKCLGYKIGRYLIHEVKKQNPQLDSVRLVREDAKKMLRLSKVKL